MTKQPLYQQIIDYFLKELREGRVRPGDRIPTESELDRQFEVSRITVIRALKEMEHLGLLYRVKGRGSFISERSKWLEPTLREQAAEAGPSAESAIASFAAQSGDPGPSPVKFLAVVLPVSEQIGFDIIRGAQEECARRGYYLSFHCTNYDVSEERDIVERLRRDGAHGIIVYPCASDENLDVFSRLYIDRFPFVVIDRKLEGINVPSVVSNNFQGAYEATSHLLDQGHRNVAFVCASIKEAESVVHRYRGYCQALLDRKVPLRTEWVVEEGTDALIKLHYEPAVHPDKFLERAAASVEKLIALPEETRPTAIFAVNDFSAMFIQKAAIQRGLSVPGELSIVGFDNQPFTAYLEVPLTTIEQPFFEMGRAAASMLLHGEAEQVWREPSRVLDVKLVVRESTTAPKTTEKA